MSIFLRINQSTRFINKSKFRYITNNVSFDLLSVNPFIAQWLERSAVEDNRQGA